MSQRLSFLIAVTFLQVLSTSSRGHAQEIDYGPRLDLIANTADRICGVVKDTGSASSAAAKGVVSVELRGLASQLGAAGQGSGGITSEEYQGVLREQLAPLIDKSTECKFQVFQILQLKLLPGYTFPAVPQPNPTRNPPIVRASLPCQKEQLIDWLDQHGIYGNRPFDISVYDDQVNWIVNGKPSRKTRTDIAKEEDIFRRLYPMQRYTPSASSAAMVGDQCVLTQQVDGYKKSATGNVEFNNFRFEFGIRSDANGPHIVERQTDVLNRR